MDRELMENKFDGKKEARLGSKKNPARLSVQTKTRMKEVAQICKDNGWECKIEIDSKNPENIAELEMLQYPTKTIHVKDKE